MSRHATQAALLAIALTAVPGYAQARCFNNADVTCPLRSELTVAAGFSTEELALTGAWTTVRRIGAYARLYPGLEPKAPARENAIVTSEKAYEFGLTFRVLRPLTVGLGYAKLTQTHRTFGADDPVTFRPTLLDESIEKRSGPSLLLAWSLHPPRRQIGFAITGSVGAVGTGISIGTTLRFIKGGATPGVE